MCVCIKSFHSMCCTYTLHTCVCCLCVQWAKIIIVLERTYSRSNLLKFQKDYSVTLVGTEQEDACGLMVIKTSRKTKARQRKGAISNWKVGKCSACGTIG